MERDNRRYYPNGPDRRPDRSQRDWDWDRERPERPTRPERPERRQSSPPPRRRKKKRSSLSSSMIYILLVCGISALLAVVGWAMANDVLALNKDGTPAAITVQENRDFGDVVDQLEEKGIIKYKGLFRMFSFFTGGADKISPGTYELNTDMDYRAVLNNLGPNSASRMETSVTIQEGLTVAKIFELLEEKGVSTVEKLQETAANHDYAFSFLQDVPLGDWHRLEGYLFPDTYYFNMGEDPKYVINKMLVNFDAKVTDSVRQQIWDKGYSIGQMVTIASMIEKEATETDRATIASVIYNRLNNPNSGTMGCLQIDATIQYVLPEGQKVTEADYTGVDSPYNTYEHKGLPPGPIANPGMDAILAALNPEKTNYFYYILGDDDTHHFFTNYSDFLAFKNS